MKVKREGEARLTDDAGLAGHSLSSTRSPSIDERASEDTEPDQVVATPLATTWIYSADLLLAHPSAMASNSLDLGMSLLVALLYRLNEVQQQHKVIT